ncbi:MAG: AbgT family transporter, partial [Oscillospiraceae bacterium]|nr:AbgT family transporter [Oscillospiraceae bacterium]
MAKKERSGIVFRFLNTVERVGNRLPHPITLFFIFCMLIVVISAICEATGVSATGDLYNSATQSVERTTVYAVSLMNTEGIVYMLTSAVSNFTGFAPLGVVLVAML